MNQRYLRSKKLSLKIYDQIMSETHGWVSKTKQYSENQIFDLLQTAALRNSSLEDTSKYLIERQEGYGSVPAIDTVLRSLFATHGECKLEDLESFVSSKLQEQAQKIPHLVSWSVTPAMKRKNSRKKLRSKGMILAIYITDVEYFGKKAIYDETGRLLTPVGRGSKGKKRRVFRYATASIVFDARKVQPPITIAFAVNYKGQSRKVLVEKLLKQVYNLFQPSKPRIRFILLDGGFISQAICEYLDSLAVDFLIRARYFKKKKYPKQQRFKSKVKEYPVMAYKVRIKGADGKRRTALFVGPITNKYSAKKVLRIYRLRFRIENTYRHAKAWRIRTCVRDYRLRIVLWSVSVFLELVWELCRYFIITGTDGEDTYHLRQRRIGEIWLDYRKEHIEPAPFLFRINQIN